MRVAFTASSFKLLCYVKTNGGLRLQIVKTNRLALRAFGLFFVLCLSFYLARLNVVVNQPDVIFPHAHDSISVALFQFLLFFFQLLSLLIS